MDRRAVRLQLGSLVFVICAVGVGFFTSGLGGVKSAAGAAQMGLARVCVDPAPFPSGFDYPQQASTVEQWVAHREAGKAREHGWYLFAGLNRPAAGETPVWRTWCTSTQAFFTGFTAAAFRASVSGMNHQITLNAMRRADGTNEPINLPNAPFYPLPSVVTSNPAYKACIVPVSTTPPEHPAQQLLDGPTFQNNGDIMVAGVIYDNSAYGWIRSKKLYLGATLSAQVPSPAATAQIAPMPPSSIVLKPMMWPVSAKGYTALPVWDDLTADDGTYVGFEIQQKWKRAVAITAHPTPAIAAVNVSYLHGVYKANVPNPVQIGPVVYRGAKVAPLNTFYSFRFPHLEQMHPCDRAILDASAYWAYGRAFAKDDYLVLVAMHVLTKEQPDWTFQSVWWHDKPNYGPYAKNRPNIPPSQAPGPWRHYLMTSTYGITQPPPNANKWPVAYNPYIELAADHPIITSCINCHRRAAWPNFESSAPIHASYLATPGPGALDVYKPNNPIFDGLLTTDSMWAVSDRATSPPQAR